MGIFFVPTKGMNPQGALDLRQKQKTSKGHLLAHVNFKRSSSSGATFERPDKNQRNPDENLVFGTVRKAVEDVIARSGANVTGILFVSHQDADSESAGKRLRTYKLLARTVGSRHGFVQVPSLHDETNLLLIKKEFIGHKGSQKWPNNG